MMTLASRSAAPSITRANFRVPASAAIVPATRVAGLRAANAGRVRAARRNVVVRAETADVEGTKLDLGDSESVGGQAQYAGILGVAGYAAAHLGRWHVDRGLLLRVLALYTIFSAVVNLVTRRGLYDKVTAVIAPVSLAVYALGQEHISFLDSVTAGFGWFLAEHFEPEKAALFWVAIASLAASIYYGYGTLWYAIATGVAAGYKLLSAARDDKPLPVLLVATAAAAAYAIWKNEAFLYSLVLYVVQTLWGGFTTLQRLAKALD